MSMPLNMIKTAPISSSILGARFKYTERFNHLQPNDWIIAIIKTGSIRTTSTLHCWSRLLIRTEILDTLCPRFDKCYLHNTVLTGVFNNCCDREIDTLCHWNHTRICKLKKFNSNNYLINSCRFEPTRRSDWSIDRLRPRINLPVKLCLIRVLPMLLTSKVHWAILSPRCLVLRTFEKSALLKTMSVLHFGALRTTVSSADSRRLLKPGIFIIQDWTACQNTIFSAWTSVLISRYFVIPILLERPPQKQRQNPPNIRQLEFT